MKKPLPANASDIHLEDYEEDYEGKSVGADQMIFMGGRETEPLNGPWHYAVDAYDTCLRQRWFEERYVNPEGFTLPVDFSFDEWPEMTLPCCWNTQAPELLLYESAMVFTRRFAFTARPGERTFLRIGAANYLCRVFLNGQFVGSHEGGSTPMFFDLTDYLREDNRILLCVDATRRAHQVPTENTDWFNYGGVYRSIDLVRVPETAIRDFRVSLVPDGTFRHAEVRISLTRPADGQASFRIPELGVEAEIPVRRGVGRKTLTIRPELWSPKHPKLYAVEASFGEDRVSDETGFREIRTEGCRILLNGKELYLKGVSCHEDSVPSGKAVTEAECEKALRDAKKLGCNFMRLAHYPHTETMSRLADRLGVLLWEEIPVYWAIRFSNAATLRNASNQLRELIRRDFNRPSVIVWSVGNENADSDERLRFMRRLAGIAHREDRTRLVSAACLVNAVTNTIDDRLAAYLDVIGINEYYGWYSPDFARLPQLFENSRPEKPVIITEFGADAMYGEHGPADQKGTEEYQAEVYRRQLDTLRQIPYVRGMTPWLLYDFRCPRRTSCRQLYYNRKGLISQDRRHPKLAWRVLRDFYRG